MTRSIRPSVPARAIPTLALGLALAAAAALGGCAQTAAAPAATATDTDAVARSLAAQADAWDKAIVAKNAAAVAANVAPDFAQIEAGGAVIGREEFIKDLLDPALTIDPYTVEDFSVRVYGDTALLTGRIRMTGRSEGKRFESHFRYTDIYVRRGGAWQVVSIQITPMRK